MSIHLNGSKAKAVLGFRPAYPKVELAELRHIVKVFQADRIWCVVSGWPSWPDNKRHADNCRPQD